MPQSDVFRTGSPAVPSPRPTGPRFLSQMHQSVHDVFVRLKTRVGYVYNHREESVEQEGREHAPLAKALFYSKPSRAHPAVEPRACSPAIVELTNDLDYISLWHAKTGDNSPEEGLIDGVVRFGKVDKDTYVKRNSLPRQLL